MAAVALPVGVETAAQILADADPDQRALAHFQWELLRKLKTGTERSGKQATVLAPSGVPYRMRSRCPADRCPTNWRPV